jgi:hypothetical protein
MAGKNGGPGRFESAHGVGMGEGPRRADRQVRDSEPRRISISVATLIGLASIRRINSTPAPYSPSPLYQRLATRDAAAHVGQQHPAAALTDDRGQEAVDERHHKEKLFEAALLGRAPR